MSGREQASLQVVFLFIVPIALLYFHILPISSRVPVLLVFSLLMYGTIHKEGWTLRDVGLVGTVKKHALKMYFLATSLALCGIIILSQYMGRTHVHHWWTKPHFLFLFIVVSFFQEFAFRGFLMPLLQKIFPDMLTVVLLNALLFAGMHAIYPFPMIGLPLAFLGGIFFAVLYHKYPNLILVTISHSILNFTMVWYGFFTV